MNKLEDRIGNGSDRRKLYDAIWEPDEVSAICPECGEPVDENEELCVSCRAAAESENPFDMIQMVHDWANKTYMLRQIVNSETMKP